MSNTAPFVTAAGRLARLTLGELAVKLSLAQTAFRFGQTTFVRDKAMREIGDIRSEVARRKAADSSDDWPPAAA